jgi:hypothetical protein
VEGEHRTSNAEPRTSNLETELQNSPQKGSKGSKAAESGLTSCVFCAFWRLLLTFAIASQSSKSENPNLQWPNVQNAPWRGGFGHFLLCFVLRISDFGFSTAVCGGSVQRHRLIPGRAFRQLKVAGGPDFPSENYHFLLAPAAQ